MKNKINFNSVKEMVSWLIDNEGKILFDYYGRRWKYFNFNFNYSDLGENDFELTKIDCLHLYQTGFYYL